MKIFRFILTLSFVFICISATFATDSLLNVKEYGAKGDGFTDDLKVIQQCLELASAQNKICYFPDGFYLMKGNLYLLSNVKLKGNVKTTLKFINGGILGEKNKQRKDYYTNNYNNEFVPNQELSKVIGSNKDQILVDSSQVFKVNDDVVIFNGIKDSWEILEDAKMSSLWNTDKVNKMAKGGSFKISSIRENKISTAPVPNFDVSSKSLISKRAGVVNVSISNLTIISDMVNYAIQLEQPKNVTLTNLVIRGNGGVLLSNFANNCKVSHCNIETTKNASVLIENFSSENSVVSNVISYSKGKTFQSGSDAAIILMMGSFNNEVSNNMVNCTGLRENDEGGIFVHALSYDNNVYDNKIIGASEGIGIYYGAYGNKFTNNKIQDVRVGIISYYARQSVFDSNRIVINSKRPGNKIGILSFASNDNNYVNNNIKGMMTFGVLLQSSRDFLSLNEITGPTINVYSVGLKVIGNNLGIRAILSTNKFNGFKLQKQ